MYYGMDRLHSLIIILISFFEVNLPGEAFIFTI